MLDGCFVLVWYVWQGDFLIVFAVLCLHSWISCFSIFFYKGSFHYSALSPFCQWFLHLKISPMPSVGFLYLKKKLAVSNKCDICSLRMSLRNVTWLLIRPVIYLCCAVRTSGSWRFRMCFYSYIILLEFVFLCCGSWDLVKLDLLESKHEVRDAPEQGPCSDADEFGADAGLFMLGNLRDCYLISQTFS